MKRFSVTSSLALLCAISVCAAQKWNQETSHWNHKELGSGSNKACSNLTQVLDNWKFAIVTQVKELLIHDHAAVLPEYSRIPALSDALGDLYRQFNQLKDELRSLTAKFDGVEAFADALKDGTFTAPRRALRRTPPSVGLRAQMRPPDRRIMTRPRGGGPGRS